MRDCLKFLKTVEEKGTGVKRKTCGKERGARKNGDPELEKRGSRR